MVNLRGLGVAMLVLGLAWCGGCKEEPSKPAAPAGATHGAASPGAVSTEKPKLDLPSLDMDDRAVSRDQQARTLLEQVTGAIRDGRLDDARPLLARLEAMAPTLPEALQKQIAVARKELDAKR